MVLYINLPDATSFWLSTAPDQFIDIFVQPTDLELCYYAWSANHS